EVKTHGRWRSTTVHYVLDAVLQRECYGSVIAGKVKRTHSHAPLTTNRVGNTAWRYYAKRRGKPRPMYDWWAVNKKEPCFAQAASAVPTLSVFFTGERITGAGIVQTIDGSTQHDCVTAFLPKTPGAAIVFRSVSAFNPLHDGDRTVVLPVLGV
ncbi:hypothetical protein M513_02298, partial [Trichuris suis]